MNERTLGCVTVDSGEMVIIDPCYLDEEIHDNLRRGVVRGAYVVLKDFGGDGRFPVRYEKTEDGRLLCVIDFGKNR